MKGNKQYGPGAETAIAELYGGVRERIILFAAETGLSAHWVAQRLAALLSPERERLLDHLPVLRDETAGLHRAVESVEMVVHAHRSQTQPANVGTAGQDATGKTLTSSSTQKAYWAKMTAEERSKEFARRRKKWSPEAKARWRDKKRPKTQSEKQRQAKQNAYQQRHRARKRGEPLPPIPQATSAA